VQDEQKSSVCQSWTRVESIHGSVRVGSEFLSNLAARVKFSEVHSFLCVSLLYYSMGLVIKALASACQSVSQCVCRHSYGRNFYSIFMIRCLKSKIEFVVTFVQKTGDLTISSSVWPTIHPNSRNPRCGTTLSVVSTRAKFRTLLQSACSVPARPVLSTQHLYHLCFTCSVPAACRPTDISSCSFLSRRAYLLTFVSWRSTFVVSFFLNRQRAIACQQTDHQFKLQPVYQMLAVNST